jgi:hypothetical protein
VVALERLATFVRQDIEDRLDDVILVKVRFVGTEVPPPPFMLDVRKVVNSPVESSKYVATWIE